jgi:hypothetical protein
MPSIKYFPPVAVAVAVGRLLSGRIRFPKDRTGKLLTMENGEEYYVFDDVQVVSSRPQLAESMTVLRVRFKFDRYSDAVNRRLFQIFTPIITGMPGFQRKIWTFCEKSGDYQGIYQFESMELAERYRKSPIMWVLEKRSVPGSISYELLSDTLIEDYLDKHPSVSETGKDQ